MKIGLVSGEYPPMPGGVGAFTRILGERLRAQGHEVAVLSREGSGGDLPLTTVPGFGLGGVGAMQRFCDGGGFDIINLQYQTAAYDQSATMHFLPSLVDTPLVTTFHDLRHPYLFPKAGGLRDWIVMALAQGSDGVIATNPEDAARLNHLPHSAMIPIGSNIPRADDEDEDMDFRSRIGADDSSFVIGHFGFITPIKGIDTLLDAVAALRDDGLDLRLAFIGGRSNAVEGSEDREWLTQIDRRVRELGLAEMTHFTGYMRDAAVARAIASVDLMCLPFRDGASYRRGSLMAAVNQGSAILTTQPAVDHSSFKHGENMWLAPPESSAELADAIRQLHADPEQLQQLRDGAERLREHFDWNVITRRSAEFFADVVARAGA